MIDVLSKRQCVRGRSNLLLGMSYFLYFSIPLLSKTERGQKMTFMTLWVLSLPASDRIELQQLFRGGVYDSINQIPDSGTHDIFKKPYNPSLI